MDAVRTLESEVRELIRRSGLDPARDEVKVRSLVREAVADYDERSMLGGMPVLSDVDAASRAVWDTVGANASSPELGTPPKVEPIGERHFGKDGVPLAGPNPTPAAPPANPRIPDDVERRSQDRGGGTGEW